MVSGFHGILGFTKAIRIALRNPHVKTSLYQSHNDMGTRVVFVCKIQNAICTLPWVSHTTHHGRKSYPSMNQIKG